MYFENGEVKVEKTYIPKGNVAGEWYLVDASGQTLGRLATKIAALLIGKHRPDYTPGVVLEDHVVVINASQIHVNPTRAEEKNIIAIPVIRVDSTKWSISASWKPIPTASFALLFVVCCQKTV